MIDFINLETIKNRQENFQCFCADSVAHSNPQHHPDCMSADINQDVCDLIAEVEALRAERKASQELRKDVKA